MRRVLAMAVAGFTMVGCALAAGPARAEFAKGQELVLLTAHSAVLAAQHCPYALDERRLAAFLSRKGLKRADLDAAGSYSELLRDDMAADDARYQNDTAAACDQAWASSGPAARSPGCCGGGEARSSDRRHSTHSPRARCHSSIDCAG